MDYDIIVVGGSPAGLSAAVRAAREGAPLADDKGGCVRGQLVEDWGRFKWWSDLVTRYLCMVGHHRRQDRAE